MKTRKEHVCRVRFQNNSDGVGWLFWDGADAQWQPVGMGAFQNPLDAPTRDDIFSSLRETSFAANVKIEVEGRQP